MSEKTINKIPNVPNLRFENDNSEWKLIKIKTLLKFQNGLNESQEKYGKGTKYISVSDILNNDYIMYDCIKGFVDINIDTFNNFIVEYGDILFQRSSETIEDIGRSNVYLDKVNKSVFGGFIIRGKKIGEYDPIFFKHLLDTPTARKIIIKMGAGAQHYNISQDGLEKISLYFPTLEIQNKIGIVLSKMDLLISTQNKIIEEIKSQIFSISYIMVKSISKTIPVKEICIFERKTKHQSGDGLLGGNYPFFTNEEETVKYFNTYDFDGEYIIANTGGKANFKYHNGKFTTMSDCLVIRFRNSLLTKFYSIVFSVLQKYIDYIGFEGSGLKHLNKDWFLKLQVPQCDENAEKFICIINDLKEKLQIEKDILSLYKKQKAYLLQNMFI